MYRAVIFDVDGTLIDSVDLHARAWQRAFEHFGYPFPYGAIRDQIGKGGDQLIPYFLSPAEVQRIGKQLEEFRGELFKREYLSQARAFPHVRDLFNRLKADGVRTAVASSSRRDELDNYLQLAEIADLVDATVSKDDVEHSKPQPDAFSAALQKLGPVERERVIVIGDSPYDAEAARRAGLKTVCLLSGGFTAAQLKKSGCIALFEDPADLLQRYSSWQHLPRPPAEAGAGRPVRH